MITNRYNSWLKILGAICLQALVLSVPAYAATASAADGSVPAPDWYIDFVQARAVDVSAARDNKIVVAVIDSGVDMRDAGVVARLWTNRSEIVGNRRDDDRNKFVDDVHGWNFVRRSANVDSNDSHGTDVTKVLLATWDAAAGVTIHNQISIMPLVAYDDSQTSDPATVVNAIHYAVDNGAAVINLSLGGTLGYYSPKFDEAIKYAWRHGVLVVAAAGNGPDEDSVGVNLNRVRLSPVCNDGGSNMVLGVGVVDSNGRVPAWSNTGRCVDLSAPGVLLNGYATGSSFSAPVVSAAAALLRLQYPQLSPARLRDQLVSTATSTRGITVLNLRAAVQQAMSQAVAYEVPSQQIVRVAAARPNLPTAVRPQPRGY